MGNLEIIENIQLENTFRKNCQFSKKQYSSLYIGDLAYNIEEKDVLNIFSKMSGLVSVRIHRDLISKKSLGYGYIYFKNTKYAERAIKKMNFYFDRNLFKKPIRLMWEERDETLRVSGKGNIFINHLPDHFKTINLYKLFLPFGKILSCKICYDENGYSKKFGFVHFFSSRDAKEAIKKLNGANINGKILHICPFIKKEARDLLLPKNHYFTNIYIKNLEINKFTEENIKNMFEVFGEITSILIPEENGIPKGFAFVNFSSHLDAEEAVLKMDKKKIGDSVLYVSRAKKKGERHLNFNHRRNFRARISSRTYYKVFIVIKGIQGENSLKILIFLFSYFGNFSKYRITEFINKEFSFFFNIKLKKKKSLIFFRKKYQSIFSKNLAKLSNLQNKKTLEKKIYERNNSYSEQFKNGNLMTKFMKNKKCFKFKNNEIKPLLLNKLKNNNSKDNLSFQLKKVAYFWLKITKNSSFLGLVKFIRHFFRKPPEYLIFFENNDRWEIELPIQFW